MSDPSLRRGHTFVLFSHFGSLSPKMILPRIHQEVKQRFLSPNLPPHQNYLDFQPLHQSLLPHRKIHPPLHRHPHHLLRQFRLIHLQDLHIHLLHNHRNRHLICCFCFLFLNRCCNFFFSLF